MQSHRPYLQVSGLKTWFVLLAFVLLSPQSSVLGPDALQAHERSISYSAWSITGRTAHVICRLSALDVSRFPWAMQGSAAEVDARLASYLAAHLRLSAGDSVCAVTSAPRRLSSPPERLTFEWDVSCAATGRLVLTSSMLLDVTASHVHFARMREDNGPAAERVLTKNEPDWPLPTSSAAVEPPEPFTITLRRYVSLGFEHILSGYDHLAFLLALLLIETSLVEVARVVTGFTIAHSVTLALATLGYVRPEARAIDAWIGLSIALVAAEDAWLYAGRRAWLVWMAPLTMAALAVLQLLGHGRVPALTLAGLALFSACYLAAVRRSHRPALARWAIAFLFGLVHGFGFAGILAEAQLPPERLAGALLGFNLGVELGQLGIVIIVWPLFSLIARPARQRTRALVIEAGCAAVCGLGLFWFVTRAYG